MKEPRQPSDVGTMGEHSLHAALKEWYARPGDRFEVKVDGFLIDIVRGDLLIEIQTRGFGALKRKLAVLTERHPVRLVYPMAKEKWIVRVAQDGSTEVSRRKSPKHQSLVHLFEELVHLPQLMASPNFSLEALVIDEEEVRREVPRGGRRRRKYVKYDRRLLNVEGRKVYQSPADLLDFIPGAMGESFTTRELADAIGEPLWLAEKVTYCLRHMGAIRMVGKRGNAYLYSL